MSTPLSLFLYRRAKGRYWRLSLALDITMLVVLMATACYFGLVVGRELLVPLLGD
jgi:nitrate reductase gamma subunit